MATFFDNQNQALQQLVGMVGDPSSAVTGVTINPDSIKISGAAPKNNVPGMQLNPQQSQVGSATPMNEGGQNILQKLGGAAWNILKGGAGLISKGTWADRPLDRAGLSRAIGMGAKAATAGYPNSWQQQLAQGVDKTAAALQQEAMRQEQTLTGIQRAGITPEEYSAMIAEQMEKRRVEATEMQVEKMETPDEKYKKAVDVALIGAGGKTKNADVEVLNIGPDGKPTSAREKHKWVIDNEGNPVKYVGPFTEPSPAGADDRNIREGIYRQAVREAMDDPRLLGMKTVLVDPGTGQPTVSWKNPRAASAILRTIMNEKVQALISSGYLDDSYLARIPSETLPSDLANEVPGWGPNAK